MISPQEHHVHSAWLFMSFALALHRALRLTMAENAVNGFNLCCLEAWGIQHIDVEVLLSGLRL